MEDRSAGTSTLKRKKAKKQGTTMIGLDPQGFRKGKQIKKRMAGEVGTRDISEPSATADSRAGRKTGQLWADATSKNGSTELKTRLQTGSANHGDRKGHAEPSEIWVNE